MNQTEAQLLLTPNSETLRFLPEGPYRVGDASLSWVSIQHGTDETAGSLNLLDLVTGQNQNFPLPGRPGFAFPTRKPGVFVVGMERNVSLVNIRTNEISHVTGQIEQGVEGTIINDGVLFEGHLIFGCKELTFSQKKAGLYLLRKGETEVIKLADNQICSNGKAVSRLADGTTALYDIDTPTKQVIRWDIDFEKGTVTNPNVIVDFTSGQVYPDGMIMTPDGKSLIVAFYDPRESDHGQACQYSIATGELEHVWTCPASPRVTCPQLISRNGKIELVLTTADEGMSPELRNKAVNAGCLFVAETHFTGLSDCPVYEVQD